jgi:hypothetical protein
VALPLRSWIGTLGESRTRNQDAKLRADVIDQTKEFLDVSNIQLLRPVLGVHDQEWLWGIGAKYSNIELTRYARMPSREVERVIARGLDAKRRPVEVAEVFLDDSLLIALPRDPLLLRWESHDVEQHKPSKDA